jgi:hypothetical protein
VSTYTVSTTGEYRFRGGNSCSRERDGNVPETLFWPIPYYF